MLRSIYIGKINVRPTLAGEGVFEKKYFINIAKKYTMLHAQEIKKRYGQVEVLKGISLHIEQGEIVSIVGASGAGKSTLLNILGTLEKADSGSIYFEGNDISRLRGQELSVFRNSMAGFVFQFHNLLPEFTAWENVCIPALIGGKKYEEAKKRATELLELLGLGHRLEHKPSMLSGGEQQRVAVARALINQPKIVLADEPSGNLDSQNAKELHTLFFELQMRFKQAFVIVTHNEELANMAHRKLEMRDGYLL